MLLSGEVVFLLIPMCSMGQSINQIFCRRPILTRAQETDCIPVSPVACRVLARSGSFREDVMSTIFISPVQEPRAAGSGRPWFTWI